jgi:hypothetical protein
MHALRRQDEVDDVDEIKDEYDVSYVAVDLIWIALFPNCPAKLLSNEDPKKHSCR